MTQGTETAEPQVLLEKRGEHVAILRLNRPQQHNAISAAMAEAIERYIDEVEEDPDIRVVIVAANGKSFCAGADLRETAEGRGGALIRERTGFGGFVYAARRKPYIAAVHGIATAGGMEIALACDMIVAGEAASFGLAEVRRGVIAGAGGVYRVARALPRAVAIEIVTTGFPIGAKRAFDLGMVNRLVPTEKVLDEALDLATIICANSPLSVRESLALTRASADQDEAGLRALQDTAMAAVLAGPDSSEGPTAFVEKRPPVWRT